MQVCEAFKDIPICMHVDTYFEYEEDPEVVCGLNKSGRLCCLGPNNYCLGYEPNGSPVKPATKLNI
jgi:hypothetical protein